MKKIRKSNSDICIQISTFLIGLKTLDSSLTTLSLEGKLESSGGRLFTVLRLGSYRSFVIRLERS